MQTVAIMQPYLFPHLGYFQLLAMSDVFVAHDDVQFIKGGWINRNKVLLDGDARWVTLPVTADAHDLAIDQRRYAADPSGARAFLRRVEAAYSGAPHFGDVFGLVEAVLRFEDRNVAAFNTHALAQVAELLEITTPIRRASELTQHVSLTGAERVLAICQAVGAERYVNPIGGVTLYRPDQFAAAGVQLRFLRPKSRVTVGLSVIHQLMVDGVATVKSMLSDYSLV